MTWAKRFALNSLGDEANQFFSIDETTGELTLTASLDFETNPGPIPFSVLATDDALEPGTVPSAQSFASKSSTPMMLHASFRIEQIIVSDSARPGEQIGLVSGSR